MPLRPQTPAPFSYSTLNDGFSKDGLKSAQWIEEDAAPAYDRPHAWDGRSSGTERRLREDINGCRSTITGGDYENTYLRGSESLRGGFGQRSRAGTSSDGPAAGRRAP